jgi:hypothetical protein
MTPTIPLEDTIVALPQLHFLLLDLIPPPIFDYQLQHIVAMDWTLFTQSLTIAPHLFLGGFYGMVYEHLLKCFIPKDPSTRFSKLL